MANPTLHSAHHQIDYDHLDRAILNLDGSFRYPASRTEGEVMVHVVVGTRSSIGSPSHQAMRWIEMMKR
jgi:hypothetical protein